MYTETENQLIDTVDKYNNLATKYDICQAEMVNFPYKNLYQKIDQLQKDINILKNKSFNNK
jgi:hypothetical protein